MGDLSGDAGSDEKPVHDVTIAAPFAVGKYEVTFAEWDACVAAGGCTHRPDDEGWGLGTRPAINVSWDDAQEYVRWLSRETGKSYRLLSEAEWEYVARAGSATKYPWGDDVGTNKANCDGCGSQWDNKRTAPVGSFKPNASACSIPRATCGNGWRIVRTILTVVRRLMGARGRAGIVIVACCAAVPGTTIRGSFAQPTASGSTPVNAATSSGSVLPGRWINACFFTSLPLGVWGLCPQRKFLG